MVILTIGLRLFSSCDLNRCGHCKKLEPIYSVVARQLKALAPDVVMARVDATVETELAKDYDITGYPTLMMFRKGRQYEYQGPRTENG